MGTVMTNFVVGATLFSGARSLWVSCVGTERKLATVRNEPGKDAASCWCREIMGKLWLA